MRLTKCVFAGVLAVAVVGLATAQQPGRQPGRQPGGFGQNMVAVAVIDNADLQADLKVTADQKAKFKAVAEKQAEMAKKMREAFQGGQFDREKMQEMMKDRQKVSEEAVKLVDTTLTADQKKRVKQIEVQVQGLRAFGSEETVKPLALTDSQKTKIKGIADEANKTIGEARREAFGGGMGRPDPEKMAEVNKKVQKLQKQAMAEVADVLTADQKKTWEGMVGEPFDTTKLGAFGFGGGRPRQKD